PAHIFYEPIRPNCAGKNVGNYFNVAPILIFQFRRVSVQHVSATAPYPVSSSYARRQNYGDREIRSTPGPAGGERRPSKAQPGFCIQHSVPTQFLHTRVFDKTWPSYGSRPRFYRIRDSQRG